MSVFTPEEIQYLQNQPLARIATVGPSMQPHVVPLGFRYNPDTDTIDISGHEFAQSKKWRDVQHNPRVAVTIDDIVSLKPWRVRGIEIRGEAELLLNGGESVMAGFASEMFRITPKRIVSWGINPPADHWEATARSVNTAEQ